MTDLRTALDTSATALARNPDAGLVRFTAGSDLVGVLEVDVRIRDHVVKADEPPSLGGTGLAPNPVELALAALGSCQAITYRVWAEKLGIRIDRVRVEVQGSLDVRGFLGVQDGVRPGLRDVDVRVRISGPEPPDRYAELQDAVDEHCPVLDVLANPVPVATSMTVGA